MDFFLRYARWGFAFALVMIAIGGYQALFAAPADFPSGSIVTIARGSSAPAVAAQLAADRVIKHPLALRALLRALGQSTNVRSGAYLFSSPQDLFTVAGRLVAGVSGFPPTRLTFVEGATVRDMAAQVADALPDISADAFTEEAQPYEGYLFPDTYLFPQSTDAAAIVRAMRDNFNSKTAQLTADIAASGRSLSDTVILASLVEKEARSIEAKHMVAGILENRLAKGMPLQVDAVFGYIKGRDTYSPSYADLTIDSLYNTYTHKGLPPGPIDNPGLDSLDAVVHPTKSDYLYYLTGKDGQMHYATTYAAHQVNERRYLQ